VLWEIKKLLGAILVIIGDELLAGEIPDRSGPFPAEELTSYGFQIQGIHYLMLKGDTP
jgi:molybdopterin-biosynthesis enzyme MoeA-like protein